MRFTVLTLSICSLLLSCFTGIGLSHASESIYEHHAHEHVIVHTHDVSDEQQIDKHNYQCDDCCSHHHSPALLLAQLNPPLSLSKQTSPWYSDDLYATHVVGLKRPPKA